MELRTDYYTQYIEVGTNNLEQSAAKSKRLGTLAENQDLAPFAVQEVPLSDEVASCKEVVSEGHGNSLTRCNLFRMLQSRSFREDSGCSIVIYQNFLPFNHATLKSGCLGQV
jgi:hypothetical protein